MQHASEYYEREEVERFTKHNWASYCFALGNAIGYLFKKDEIPLVVSLIKDEKIHTDAKLALGHDLGKKMRRWKMKDPEIEALIKSVKPN